MAQRTQKSSQQRTVLLQTQLRGIRAKALVMNSSTQKIARREVMDLYGDVDGCLGVIKMNKEHNYNMLTPNFINEIQRGIQSMDADQIVSTIYMAPHRGKMWSNGTDFRALAQMQKEGSADAIAAYFTQLYNLQIKMGALNKPLIAAAPGNAFNSGATLLAATGLPLVNNGTKLAFDEATYGFVPHAGATYYLSRLPGEFGTFLALTGMRIDGSDAIRLGLADGAVQDSTKLDQELGEIIRAQEWRPTYGQDYYDNRMQKEKLNQQYLSESQQRTMEYIYRGLGRFENIDKNRLANGLLDTGKYEDFIEAKDRIPSAVADAEFRYMQMLRADEKLHNTNNADAYLEYAKNEPDRENMFLYFNNYKTQYNYVQNFLDSWYKQDVHVAIRHRKLIDRCFYSRSVEEIMENLRKEVHPFAQECLKQMERNSLVSLQLTREMMHRAQNLDYTGCMEMEVRVGMNRIKDTDFAIGVDKVFRAKVQGDEMVSTTAKPRKLANPGFSNKTLTQSQIEKYFDESDLSKKVNVAAVRYALLPTRHYFERFTDHLRIWINEESASDGRIRHRFDEQAKEALRQEGIDVRDKALTIQQAREHLAGKLAKERVEKVRQERFDQIMLDEQLRDRYFGEVNKELESLISDNKMFYSQVNKHISDVFQIALNERLQKIYDRSKEAQSLEKRRMFVRLKKFFFKNRVLTYAKETFNAEVARCRNYPYRLPHGHEKPDQSWHDVAHPLASKSPLHLLSKAIGRVSISPVEMTKEFLTNPNSQGQLSMLTLDRKELNRLQNDVLQNPEKYIEAFTRPEEPHNPHFMKRSEKEEIFLRRDYWFRLYNDQITPMEKWPKKQHYEMYKAWAEEVEGKAIDTLRNCISQLLISLKDNLKLTPEFEKGSTKREKLEHLMALLNESIEVPTVRAAKSLTRPEKQDSQHLDSLHQLLQQQLEKDTMFSAIYARDEDGNLTNNPRVVQLRQEAEKELLQLIEIVLLDKYGAYTSEAQKEQLEKRLKQLMQPRGSDKNSDVIRKQLGVIDWYLERETRHEALKDVLVLVKPYFANIFQRKLQQHASELLDELQWKTTNHLVQFYYFGDMIDPSFTQGSAAEKRMLNPHHKHEERMMTEKAFPLISPIQEMKEMKANWSERKDIHLDPDYQKKSLNKKKGLEEREARKRMDEYERLQAQIVIDDCKSKGIYDPSDIIMHMMASNGPQSESTKRLLDQLDEQELETLRTNGFSDHHLKVLQKIVDIKKKFAEDVPDNKDFDYLKAYENLKRTDRYEIETMEQMKKRIEEFLTEFRYELDNHLNAFDWLKMYAHVLGKVNFNNVIEDYHRAIQQLKAQEKMSAKDLLLGVNANYEYVKPTNLLKTDEAWAEIQEYAQFICKFFEANTKSFNSQVTVDLEKYMVAPSSDGRSIFQRAMAARDEFIAKDNSQNAINRNLLIKDAISDFNALQKQKQHNLKLKAELRASAGSKPRQVRDFVEEVLSSDNSYVDLNILKQRLENDSLILDSRGNLQLSGLINTQRLINDFKNGQAMPGFLEKFSNSHIDVLSLEEAKSLIQADQALGESDKANAFAVVQHIFDATQTMSNSQRKAITVGQFLSNQSKHCAYTKYASNLLMQKLKDAMDSLDYLETASNVDWEIGRSRTNPYDFREDSQKTREQIDDLIQRIVDDKEENPQEQISYYDDEVKAFRLDRTREYELKKVLLDAADVTTLPKDLIQAQAFYENKFLAALVSPDHFESQAQSIINEYTDLRLKQCMLQPAFQTKMKSQYGFLYMKMLRERVMDELKITKESEIMNLESQEFLDPSKKFMHYNVESMYNLNDLNNPTAMGFDNLLERANETTNRKRAESAQKTVVDKLLADYFLGKKAEYSEANKLVYDLAEIFEKDNVLGINSMDTVLKKQNTQNMNKEESKHFHFEAFKDMFDLDIITSRTLQNNKNGLSDELRQLSIAETSHKDHWLTQVPEYFEVMDVRKPPKQVVEDRLFLLIKEAFDVRKELETSMNRRELLAFDNVLARHLQLENLAPRLREAIKEEFNIVNQGRQITEQKNNNSYNAYLQDLKRPNTQREFNKSVKNPDAQYKHLAYATMVEQETKAVMNRPGKTSPEKLEIQYYDQIFPRWYLKELEKDAKRDPRPIDPADFRHKKPFEMPGIEDEFMDRNAREKAMFEDQQIYLENKKEQQERMQLFYVLEQFFEHARTKPDPNSEAQKTIKEYFGKQENTFFFDRNKL